MINPIPSLRWGDLTIPPAKSINAAASARSISVAAERSEIPLVYGEDRIKALIVNVLPAGTNSPNLLVQCLWCYAGDSVNDLRLNDKALPAGSSQTHYTGTQTTPDASLVTAFSAQLITYADTLNGFMYSVITMPTAAFDGQLDFSARIRGRKLYDPRQDSTAGGSGAQRLATPSTWVYSDNPALAESDFLRSTVYGLGRTVDQSTVATTANACDALIGSPSEKRRIVGVSFTQSASANDIADALRAYAGCFLLPGANGIKLVPDIVGSSVATYLHASGDIASLTDLERADIGNIPTVVEVSYTDTSTIPWREGVAVASVAGAGSTKPWRVSQIKLPGIKRYSQAFREATERLAKLSTNDISATLEVFDIGIVHEQGDIVTVTHPVGISAMTLRVANVEMPAPGRWRLRLKQYSASAYSTATPAAPAYLTSGFTSQGGPPSDVSGLAASGAPGAGRISWTPNTHANYLETELRTGASWAAGVFLARISGSAYPWNSVTEGTYTVWAKHRDTFGNESTNAVSISITVDSFGITAASFQGYGQNRLSESDQPVLPRFFLSNSGNGASFEFNNVLYPEAWGWTTANFVLQGGRTRNIAARQVGRHTGTVTPDADAAGNTAAADLVFDSWFPVVAGERVCASAYVVSQRCTTLLYMAVYDAAGTLLAAPPFTQPTAQINLARTTASTNQAHSLGLYQRPYFFAVMPANAARARLILRKYNTVSGQTDSWVFAAAPDVEGVAANTLSVSPYQPGPVAAIGTDQIVAGTATTLVSYNSSFTYGTHPSGASNYDLTYSAHTISWTNNTARPVDVHLTATINSYRLIYTGSYPTQNVATASYVSAGYSVSAGGGAGASLIADTAPDAGKFAVPISGAVQFTATVPPNQTVSLTLSGRIAFGLTPTSVAGEYGLYITAIKL
jgi:hypothetical protein